LLRQGPYGLFLILQGIFYALAGLTMLRLKNTLLSQLSNVSLTFIVLNAAAAVALMHFITGRKIEWERTDHLQADNPMDFLRNRPSQGQRQTILTAEPRQNGIVRSIEMPIQSVPRSTITSTEPSDLFTQD
jgi:hypothetical protein